MPRKAARRKKAARRRPAHRDIKKPGRALKIVQQLGEVDFDARTITSSSRSTFLECRTKFRLSYGHRLSARGLVDYFWVGGVVHDELERMYTRGKMSKRLMAKRVDRRTREALSLCSNDAQREKLWKASATAQGILPVYKGLYLAEDLDRFEILECEGTFEREIPDTGWTYRGKRDMMVRARRDIPELDVKAGAVGLWENKTTAAMDSAYFARLPLDFQILGYVWSAEPDFGRPSFIMYNVIQKTRLRQKRDETFGQYLDRVEEDYRVDTPKYFYREPVKFTWPTVDSFVEELQQYVDELEWCIANDRWTMNTRACTAMGICEFLPLCIDGPNSDTLTMYRQREHAHPELDGEE